MTGYLYRGSPWLEEVNAQIMEWRRLGLSPASRDRCGQVTSSGDLCGRTLGHPGKHVPLRAERFAPRPRTRQRPRSADRGRP